MSLPPLAVKVIHDLASSMTAAAKILDEQASRIRFLEARESHLSRLLDRRELELAELRKEEP